MSTTLFVKPTPPTAVQRILELETRQDRVAVWGVVTFLSELLILIAATALGWTWLSLAAVVLLASTVLGFAVLCLDANLAARRLKRQYDNEWSEYVKGEVTVDLEYSLLHSDGASLWRIR